MPIKAVQQFMLGTVLSNEQQARETLAAMKAAGYDGIELCGFMIHPIGFVVKLLTKAAGMPVGKGGNLDWHKLVQETGLQVVSLHTDLGSLERDAHAVAEEAKSFGTQHVVITGMYRFDYGDEAAMHELAQRLNKAGEALAAEGIHLLYHNHNCELRHVNAEKRAYDILLEETDPAFVNFEFDSYWFTEGGANALAWMQRLGPRMKLWHINDRGTRITGSAITPILKTDSMELGTGNMDLDSLMAQALAVEVDSGKPPQLGGQFPHQELPAQCKIPCAKILTCHSLIIFFFIIPIKAMPRTGYSFRCGALCFAGNLFALQGVGARLQGQASAIREGDFCGSVAGHGDGVGHGIACILPATFNAPHRGIVHCFCPSQSRVRGGGDGQLLPYQMDAAHAAEQPAADGTVGVMVQGFAGVSVCVNARPCLPDGGSALLDLIEPAGSGVL